MNNDSKVDCTLHGPGTAIIHFTIRSPFQKVTSEMFVRTLKQRHPSQTKASSETVRPQAAIATLRPRRARATTPPGEAGVTPVVLLRRSTTTTSGPDGPRPVVLKVHYHDHDQWS